jgi:hypothetical protein
VTVSVTRNHRTSLHAADVIVVGACGALMIGIHLPWFDFGSPATGYFSFSATSLRSWMYLPFLGALATVVYLILTAAVHGLRLPLPHRLVLVAVTGADLLLTAVCFAKKEIGVQWDIGAYVSIMAAAVALAGAIAPRHAPTRPGARSDDGEAMQIEAPLGRQPQRDDRA